MADSSPKVLQFKVSLKGSKPLIWRRILVPEDYSFHDLHLAIQDTMEWKNYHLHQFTVKNPSSGCTEEIGMEENGEFGMEILSGDRLQISDYFLAPKSKANYMYDFGDDWVHVVVLEKIIPKQDGQVYPQCVAGKNAGPPEDCGGIDGYLEMLEKIRNPGHEEHQEMLKWLEGMNWLDGDFNPAKFDPTAVKFSSHLPMPV